MQMDPRPKRNNLLFDSNSDSTNKFFQRILILRGMTFKFEYLGKFEFIFENNLEQESGDQEHAFDEKKTKSKISCKFTFKCKRGRQRVFNSQRVNMFLYTGQFPFSHCFPVFLLNSQLPSAFNISSSFPPLSLTPYLLVSA